MHGVVGRLGLGLGLGLGFFMGRLGDSGMESWVV